MDGYLTSNGVVSEVWSTEMKPRLAGDGCGCTRGVRQTVRKPPLGDVIWGDEYVVKLCERHGREPGIVRYMLE